LGVLILKSYAVDLGVDLEGEAMKVCDVCRIEKDDEEFNWRWKNLGVRAGTCRSCRKEYNKEYFNGPAKERHLQH
jgi:hypothetical protein